MFESPFQGVGDYIYILQIIVETDKESVNKPLVWSWGQKFMIFQDRILKWQLVIDIESANA